MFDNLDFTDRRTRRDTGLNPRRSTRRYVLVGEKDFYNTSSPADYREFCIVRDYNQR